MPAIPDRIDIDPELLGDLANGQLGTIANDNALLARRYGQLAIRFNTLRAFTKCIREQINNHKSAEGCL